MLLALFIAITAWLLGLAFPWWTVAIPGLIFGTLLAESGKSAFLWGFLGIGALWFIQALLAHLINDGILTTRIAELFSLPTPILVILITVLIGGLIGGLTTLTGYLFRKLFS